MEASITASHAYSHHLYRVSTLVSMITGSTKLFDMFLTTGTLKKNTYPKDKAYRKLTPTAQMLILHIVVEKPGILLHEVQNQLLEVLLLEVDISTICRFLHKSGFTRQKLRYVALQQDDYL